MPPIAVLDASAIVEMLVGEADRTWWSDVLASDLHAPQLLDIEVMSVLRGLERGRRITAESAEQAWAVMSDLSVTRHPFAVTAPRVWELRHQFTTYDASYVALAEALDARLLTCDRKLAAPGHRALVTVL
ncbi:type II toxin-antitoxin system VapC family toxin [Helcobacillus massiliensis]|uniref:type II toxin-antitoxin system VapC family toxin n=1 Tax=Helcobacillus massiliensis TaxID=521392 RepID=UPI002557A4C5|nr:type II toxin-antitoxin system VapC family toxin [Helcobacillus massiliensis]MDK7741916.1 type II toxin-antitoxin system VapC family toxin [Helcobacillus massiliensis]WOO92893.1 type II toxin-antitoxin system VapC family toxin [Helcobacillus massiliensis]